VSPKKPFLQNHSEIRWKSNEFLEKKRAKHSKKELKILWLIFKKESKSATKTFKFKSSFILKLFHPRKI
jgi:hypothetical protein